MSKLVVVLFVISLVVACCGARMSDSGPIQSRLRTSYYAGKENLFDSSAARDEKVSGSESRLGSYTAWPVKGRVSESKLAARPAQVSGNANRSLKDEMKALLSFKQRLINPKLLGDWNPQDSSPCHWSGVYCVENHVVAVSLANLGLKGTISPELGKLSQLTALMLNGNHLQGQIPSSLTACPLQIMDLSHNYLSGPIPTGGSFDAMPSEWFRNNLNLCGGKISNPCYID